MTTGLMIERGVQYPKDNFAKDAYLKTIFKLFKSASYNGGYAFGDFVINFLVRYEYDGSYPMDFKCIDFYFQEGADSFFAANRHNLHEVKPWNVHDKEPVCEYGNYPSYFKCRTFIYKVRGCDIAVVRIHEFERKINYEYESFSATMTHSNVVEYAGGNQVRIVNKISTIYNHHLEFITEDLMICDCNTAFNEFKDLCKDGWEIFTECGTLVNGDNVFKVANKVVNKVSNTTSQLKEPKENTNTFSNIDEKSLTDENKKLLESYDKLASLSRNMFIAQLVKN